MGELIPAKTSGRRSSATALTGIAGAGRSPGIAGSGTVGSGSDTAGTGKTGSSPGISDADVAGRGSDKLRCQAPRLGILHCDMNAYYASVEQVLNPALKGLPLAVCGSVEDRHGIVLAKSQEAKIQGVKTGETIWQAQSKCPQLHIVPPHYEAYVHYSKRARAIYAEVSNQVEPFGLDECWLDVRGSRQLFGSPEAIAELLRQRIKRELGLTISVGVSINKVFAKLGSDMKKPDAVTVLRSEDIPERVWNLPVEDLLGVGPATKRKLNLWGISTIGQLSRAPAELLQRRLGINGYRLWRWANGWDDGRVRVLGESGPVRSIGHSLTLRHDLVSKESLWPVFLSLAQNLALRLRSGGFRAGGVQISLRDQNFFEEEFQTPLPYPSHSSVYLARCAYKLFTRMSEMPVPLRAVGIRAIQLIPLEQPLQLNFFSDARELERLEKIEDCIYNLRGRFGEKSVSWAVLQRDLDFAEQTPDEIHPPNLPVFGPD